MREPPNPPQAVVFLTYFLSAWNIQFLSPLVDIIIWTQNSHVVLSGATRMVSLVLLIVVGAIVNYPMSDWR